MTRWLTAFCFLFLLAASVPAGTTFVRNGMDKQVCPMKCCKEKSAEQAEPKQTDIAICRTLNCSTPLPTSKTSSAQMNFLPNLVLSENRNLFALLFSDTSPDEARPPGYETAGPPSEIQPKYIRHKSLLI